MFIDLVMDVLGNGNTDWTVLVHDWTNKIETIVVGFKVL